MNPTINKNKLSFPKEEINIAPEIITAQVKAVLTEDIGSGDITASLIPAGKMVKAQVITRESAIICGVPWVNEVFRQVDPTIIIDWKVRDGDAVTPEQIICSINGLARSILTAERCALNFLQTLSGTATVTRQYAEKLAGTQTQLLDTRKTIPGLRLAQKYAVRCGGGKNHRLGLYDAFLIKENHIMSCGSITAAITSARKNYPHKPIEVEVENLLQLQEALAAKADMIMLDNFTLENMRAAVAMNNGQAKLEISGNVELNQLNKLAKLGVDYISVGALTKHLRAIDLSLRFCKI